VAFFFFQIQNKHIFGVDAEYAYNIEDYVDKSLNKSSSEVFASSNFDMFDFYIKLGFTLNYDNQPAVIGNEIDCILKSGFGWEFN